MVRTGAEMEEHSKGGPDEFGDFQTPHELAARICRFLAAEGVAPAAILEPTCGKGALLLSALDQFPAVLRAIGIDIKADYVAFTRAAVQGRPNAEKVLLARDNFFAVDWTVVLAEMPNRF